MDWEKRIETIIYSLDDSNSLLEEVLHSMSYIFVTQEISSVYILALDKRAAV